MRSIPGAVRLGWEVKYGRGPRLTSAARRLRATATQAHATVRIDPSARLGPGFDLVIPGHGTFIVHENVEFRRGFVCEISAGGTVEIGAQSIFTSYALVQCSTRITIGQRCVFGQDTLIADGFHRFRDPDLHLLDQGYDFRPIVIEDGAVVTSKCTITNSIGERALVGANSVVTKPVPAFTLVAGSPARPIEYFGPDVALRPAVDDG